MSTQPFAPYSIARRDFIKKAGYAAASATFLAQSLAVMAEESAQPVALALVGGAHIHTPNYIRILNTRKEVKVKHVWDHDAERATKCAKALNSQVAADLKTVWSDPEVKAVVICSETN